jgi:hypothetical protein
MNELLERVIKAHGGLDRWGAVKSIAVDAIISGQLLEAKGFPEHLFTRIEIDTAALHTTLTPYGGVGRRGVFTPDRIWIETLDGTLVEERLNPRAAFAGHVRATKWDELHRLYFLGYALWNYLTTPFLLAQPGFELEELAPHQEDGEAWRVLRVRFPATVPTHCDEQLFYFSAEGMLKRFDYVTDIAGGVAAHYPYDPKTIDGIVFPTRRRVVQRKPEGPKLTGITGVYLDFLKIQVAV